VGTRYNINLPPMTELHRKEVTLRVEMLREFVNKNERWFGTQQEVLDYLNDVVGARTKDGRRLTRSSLYYWRRKLHFPYERFGIRRAPVTSNVLIMAWLWSLRVYRATSARPPRGINLSDAIAHLL
jgi:hypothetical protein